MRTKAGSAGLTFGLSHYFDPNQYNNAWNHSLPPLFGSSRAGDSLFVQLVLQVLQFFRRNQLVTIFFEGGYHLRQVLAQNQ